MKPRTRKHPVQRDRRTSSRGQATSGRQERSFDVLENRFLLTSASLTPKPLVQVLIGSPTGGNLGSSAPLVNQSMVNVGPSLELWKQTTTEDEAFVLPAASGLPSIRVDLLLTPDPLTLSGGLQVSTGSGQPFYDIPLSHVDALHAELPITSTGSTPSTLGIDLVVNSVSVGVGRSRSFQIVLFWNDQIPADDPLARQTPQNLTVFPPPVVQSGPFSTSSASPSLGASSSIATFGPSLSASGNLPVLVVSATPSGIPTTSENLTDDPATSSNNKAPIPPPGANSSAPIAQSHISSGSVSMAGQAPSAGMVVPYRAAVVGPLPLSGPTPDGGIFADSPVSTTSNEPAMVTIVEPTPVLVTESSPGPLAAMIRRTFGNALPLPRSFKFAPLGTPSEVEASSEPAEAAALLLPSIRELADPGRDDRMARKFSRLNNSEADSRFPKTIRPVPSLAGALIGTAGLFLGLVAPDCVAKLTAWRDEGRTLRRRPVAIEKTR